jgi:hypothetical protein
MKCFCCRAVNGVRIAHRSSDRQRRAYPTLAEQSSISCRSLTQAFCVATPLAQSPLRVTEGANEAFLGDVGDQNAILEEAGGRQAEAGGGRW